MTAALHHKQIKVVTALLFLALIINIVFWHHGRSLKNIWVNVPPPPNEFQQDGLGLSDPQLAYRSHALMIQNTGDFGGLVKSLEEYDYERLTQWFYTMDELDNRSDFIAYLAAYYFGSANSEEKLRPLVAYLADTGERDYKEKWRFLAHAAYLARFELNDLELAFDYAKRLSNLNQRYDISLPSWASQMHIYITNLMGNKQEAYGLMLNLLETEAHKMHPNEVNFIRDYICNRILTADEKQSNALCEFDE